MVGAEALDVCYISTPLAICLPDLVYSINKTHQRRGGDI